jgi:outer membrane protein assembly factor BamA
VSAQVRAEKEVENETTESDPASRPSPAGDAGEAAPAPAPEATGESAENPQDNRADIEEPDRPRYIIESIECRGNHKTLGTLIISHLLFKPGETLDEEKVEHSRIRLLALGYFKDARMRLERGSMRGRVKVIVEVDERNTIIVDDLFFGVSSSNPVWGGLGISELNFLGRGMVLSGAFVASEYQQGGRLGLYWPSVMNTNFTGGIQALVSNGREAALAGRMQKIPAHPECDVLTESDQFLPYFRAGGVLTAGIRIDRYNRVLIDMHVEAIDADVTESQYQDNSGRTCPNYPFGGYLKDDASVLSSLTLRFERDTRDDFFMPRRGLLFSVSVELASRVLGSSYEYSKYMLRFDLNFPIASDHALRLSVIGGILQDVGERGSPFFSRFFVGDHALFWIDKGSLPRNLDLNFSDTFDYGDVLFSTTAEYDIPLWAGGNFFYRAYIYGAFNFSYVTKAAFLATQEEWSGRAKSPISLDLGLKFDTPVGLFTFSLGYIVDLAW